MRAMATGGETYWGVAGASVPTVRSRLWRAAAALLGLALPLAAGLAGLRAPPWVAGLALVGCAIALWAWIVLQGRLALRAIGARSLDPGEGVRMRNLVSGLALDLDIPAPRLLAFEGGPNALVCIAGEPVIAVASSLLESFSRTEQEAVAAHCLIRVASGQVAAAQFAAALGPLGSRVRGLVGAGDDVAAAALTRYPPALAAAVQHAEARGGRYAGLWFVADGPSHIPVAEREDALSDL